jgi:hypothetical protein
MRAVLVILIALAGAAAPVAAGPGVERLQWTVPAMADAGAYGVVPWSRPGACDRLLATGTQSIPLLFEFGAADGEIARRGHVPVQTSGQPRLISSRGGRAWVVGSSPVAGSFDSQVREVTGFPLRPSEPIVVDPPIGTSPAIDDFDGDGGLDLVATVRQAEGSGFVSHLDLRSYPGGATLWRCAGCGGTPLAIQLDGDASLEILVRGTDGVTRVVDGATGGELGRPDLGELQATIAANIDADAAQELLGLSANGGPIVFVRAYDGESLAPAWSIGASSFGVIFIGLATADLDGDSIDEIIVLEGGTRSQVVVYDARTRQVVRTIATQNLFNGAVVPLAVADVDCDGVKELLVLPGLGVVELDGSRAGAAFEQTSVGPYVALADRDIDADGTSDLLYVSTRPSSIDPVFLERVVRGRNRPEALGAGLPSGVRTGAVAQLDDDAALEALVLWNGFARVVDLAQGLVQHDFPIGGDPARLAFIDHDGDGRLEVAIAIRGASSFVQMVDPRTGLEVWRSAVSQNPPNSVQTSLDLFDREGDGALDILHSAGQVLQVLDPLTGQSRGSGSLFGWRVTGHQLASQRRVLFAISPSANRLDRLDASALVVDRTAELPPGQVFRALRRWPAPAPWLLVGMNDGLAVVDDDGLAPLARASADAFCDHAEPEVLVTVGARSRIEATFACRAGVYRYLIDMEDTLLRNGFEPEAP